MCREKRKKGKESDACANNYWSVWIQTSSPRYKTFLDGVFYRISGLIYSTVKVERTENNSYPD
jgi:hypothetical protein